MAYIRKDYYEGLYGEISERDFSMLSWEAERVLNLHTTGIDGVNKLKIAFPTDEDDAETVKRCAAKIINFLHRVILEETAISAISGFTETEQGIHGKVIASVSAGNESISYSTATNTATEVTAAAKDHKVRDKIVSDVVWEYLSGITDANGVNLLYMGRYPRRFVC